MPRPASFRKEWRGNLPKVTLLLRRLRMRARARAIRRLTRMLVELDSLAASASYRSGPSYAAARAAALARSAGRERSPTRRGSTALRAVQPELREDRAPFGAPRASPASHSAASCSRSAW